MLLYNSFFSTPLYNYYFFNRNNSHDVNKMVSLYPLSFHFCKSLSSSLIEIFEINSVCFCGLIKAPLIAFIFIFLKSSVVKFVFSKTYLYSSIIFVLETVLLSVLIVILTPLLYSSSITLYTSFTAFVCKLLVGHISNVISFCAISPTSAGSSKHLTPCPILSASSATASFMLSGPRCFSCMYSKWNS